MIKIEKWELCLCASAFISFINLIIGFPLHAIWGMLFLIAVILTGILYKI